jgi:hypothetical protein
MKQINFKLNFETKLPKILIRDAPQFGAFDKFVEYILLNYEVNVSLSDSIAYLKTLGAWESEELQDIETNKARLLWISILDCRENGDSYWYMSS